MNYIATLSGDFGPNPPQNFTITFVASSAPQAAEMYNSIIDSLTRFTNWIISERIRAGKLDRNSQGQLLMQLSRKEQEVMLKLDNCKSNSSVGARQFVDSGSALLLESKSTGLPSPFTPIPTTASWDIVVAAVQQIDYVTMLMAARDRSDGR